MARALRSDQRGLRAIRIVEAVDILDAIRQAQKLGATEIKQIERATAST